MPDRHDDRGRLKRRPRDENFDIQPEEETGKKLPAGGSMYRQQPHIIAVIVGAVVILSLAVVLAFVFSGKTRHTVLTTAEETVTEVTRGRDDEPDATEETSVELTGISEKTKAATDTAASDTTQTDDSETEASGDETEAESSDESDSSEESEITWQDVDYEGIRYRVEEGEAVILETLTDAAYIEPVSEVYGYPVVGVEEGAFAGLQAVTEIVIPEGVDWISANAFNDCPNLSMVVMPDSVSGINADAFGNCISHVTIISHEAVYAENFALNAGISWAVRED